MKSIPETVSRWNEGEKRGCLTRCIPNSIRSRGTKVLGLFRAESTCVESRVARAFTIMTNPRPFYFNLQPFFPLPFREESSLRLLESNNIQFARYPFFERRVRVAITRRRRRRRKCGRNVWKEKRDNERMKSRGRISRRSMTLDSWRLSSRFLVTSSHFSSRYPISEANFSNRVQLLLHFFFVTITQWRVLARLSFIFFISKDREEFSFRFDHVNFLLLSGKLARVHRFIHPPIVCCLAYSPFSVSMS